MQQTLLCVTNATILKNIHPVPHQEFYFAFNKNPARLNDSPYDLFFVQKVEIVEDVREPGAWKVSTLGYTYAIERHADAQEVLAFHWEGHEAKNPRPHLHVGFAANDPRLPLTPKAHIPSGRVLVEDLVYFLIDELKVRPSKHRATTWRSVIEKMRAQVMKYKTW